MCYLREQRYMTTCWYFMVILTFLEIKYAISQFVNYSKCTVVTNRTYFTFFLNKNTSTENHNTTQYCYLATINLYHVENTNACTMNNVNRVSYSMIYATIIYQIFPTRTTKDLFLFICGNYRLLKEMCFWCLSTTSNFVWTRHLEVLYSFIF